MPLDVALRELGSLKWPAYDPDLERANSVRTRIDESLGDLGPAKGRQASQVAEAIQTASKIVREEWGGLSVELQYPQTLANDYYGPSYTE